MQLFFNSKQKHFYQNDTKFIQGVHPDFFKEGVEIFQADLKQKKIFSYISGK